MPGRLYWGTYSDQVASYGAGDVTTGTSWQFMVNLMQAEDQPIAGVLPDEGSTGWSDTWMIAANAKHPNCMYKWMNHMASAEANGQATVWFGEAPTSQQACDYAETIAPGHCEQTHATDEAYYDKISYWSTPQASCADEDSATTCKDPGRLGRGVDGAPRFLILDHSPATAEGSPDVIRGALTSCPER